jgi:uncharacterized protein (TIGR04222 family)
MGQPWGLSGPQFLGIYGAGMAALIIVPWVARLLIRLPSGRRVTRDLDAYEVGYLVGGQCRAADVVIAELAMSGALRVSSDGWVARADSAAFAASPAVARTGTGWDGFPAGRTAEVRKRLGEHPGVRAIRSRLAADRLAVSPPRTVVLWILTAALFVALQLALMIWVLPSPVRTWAGASRVRRLKKPA